MVDNSELTQKGGMVTVPCRSFCMVEQHIMQRLLQEIVLVLVFLLHSLALHVVVSVFVNSCLYLIVV